jgi:hypothetical protein
MSRLLIPPDDFYFCFDAWLANDLATNVLVVGLPTRDDIVRSPWKGSLGTFLLEKGNWWDVTPSDKALFGHFEFGGDREWVDGEVPPAPLTDCPYYYHEAPPPCTLC